MKKIINLVIVLYFSIITIAYPSNLRIPVGSKRLQEATAIINPSALKISELREDTIDEEKFIEKVIFALDVQREGDIEIPWLHWDLIGPKGNIVKADNPEETLKKLTPRLLGRVKEEAQKRGISFIADVHIMVDEVDESFIRGFIDKGADYISLHWEGYADKNILADRIRFIKSQNCKAGMAFNPDIDIEEPIGFVLKNNLKSEIDLFLQMSVFSGKGGQELIEEVLENIPKLKSSIDSLALTEADGGINPSNMMRVGADVLVVGSAFFGKKQTRDELAQNLHAFIVAMREGLRNL